MAAERPSENHVENPFEFFLEKLGWAVSDVGRTMLPRLDRHAGQRSRRSAGSERRPGEALRKAWPTSAPRATTCLFIGLIYPLAGLVLARLAFSLDLLPLLFPCVRLRHRRPLRRESASTNSAGAASRGGT